MRISAGSTAVVQENDPRVNVLSAMDINKISIVGVAAAMANAGYHAIGKRSRDLPITARQAVLIFIGNRLYSLLSTIWRTAVV